MWLEDSGARGFPPSSLTGGRPPLPMQFASCVDSGGPPAPVPAECSWRTQFDRRKPDLSRELRPARVPFLGKNQPNRSIASQSGVSARAAPCEPILKRKIPCHWPIPHLQCPASVLRKTSSLSWTRTGRAHSHVMLSHRHQCGSEFRILTSISTPRPIELGSASRWKTSRTVYRCYQSFQRFLHRERPMRSPAIAAGHVGMGVDAAAPHTRSPPYSHACPERSSQAQRERLSNASSSALVDEHDGCRDLPLSVTSTTRQSSDNSSLAVGG